jgi:DNA-binding CsgD family transcriptional regulator
MRDLRVCDLRAINESVLLLNSDDDQAGFSRRLSFALATLVPCELAAVESFDRSSAWKERLLGDPGGIISQHFAAFQRLGGTHPLFPSFLSGQLSRESLRLSDVMNLSRLRKLEIYDQFLKPIGVDVQIAVAVKLVDESADVLILSRKRIDFTAREKQRLTAFLPHLALARRRSLLRPMCAPSVTASESEDNAHLLSQWQAELGLTKRESEIVWWLTMGKSDTDIADICALSRRTVQKHCEHIYRKIGVEGRTAAVIHTLQHTR